MSRKVKQENICSFPIVGPAMLHLLQDIATDADEPVDMTNPLRQVIVNTHAPAVVSEVQDDSLLVAEIREDMREGKRF